MLVTKRLEIEALILVLLTVLRAGVTIMELNGESGFTCMPNRYANIGEATVASLK